MSYGLPSCPDESQSKKYDRGRGGYGAGSLRGKGKEKILAGPDNSRGRTDFFWGQSVDAQSWKGQSVILKPYAGNLG